MSLPRKSRLVVRFLIWQTVRDLVPSCELLILDLDRFHLNLKTTSKGEQENDQEPKSVTAAEVMKSFRLFPTKVVSNLY